jgi:hypothetical protein
VEGFTKEEEDDEAIAKTNVDNFNNRKQLKEEAAFKL